MIPLTIPLSSTACSSLFFMHFHRSICFSTQQALFSEVHFCMSHGYPGLGPFSLVLHSQRRSMQQALYLFEISSLLRFCIFWCYILGLYICQFKLVFCICSLYIDIRFSFCCTRVLLLISLSLSVSYYVVLSIQVKSSNLLSGIEIVFCMIRIMSTRRTRANPNPRMTANAQPPRVRTPNKDIP